MISERQLISEVGGIVRRAVSVEEALARIENFLGPEIGSVTLLLRPLGSSRFNEGAVSSFLESREFPFRGVYTAPLVPKGQSRATLIACFGTWGAPGEILRRATASIARDLGALAARIGFAAPGSTAPESTRVAA
jgi:hypothetical protein